MTDPSNSTAVIKGFAERYENLFRSQESIAADLKELGDEVKESGLAAKDVAAIKAVAKLMVSGKAEKAREKLQAMQKVADAVGLPLFDFM